MKIFTALFLIIALAILAASCERKDPQLAHGNYRGEFDVDGKIIPFNFEVSNEGTSSRVYLINGSGREGLDSVYYREDSVVVNIDVYDALLVGKVEGDQFKGYFRKNQSDKRGLPFTASRGNDRRFEIQNESKERSVSGKWSVKLISEREGKETSRYGVGVFEQENDRVTGTILTSTGDYRFLEGVLDGDELKLSAFAGSNPTLIEARFSDSTQLSGEFISPGGKVRIVAIKSDTAALPDAYKLTYLKDGFDRLSFSFPDLNGNQVSLKDEKYKGKVVVLTILGSWCPNCVDEAAFLAPWYKENKDRGVEVVGLSFERKDDIEFAKRRLGVFIKKFDIEYDILFGGPADKKVVAEKLPELNTFLSFPTTFFIDKNGRVRKVHTGYDGPATGKYYEQFKEHFNEEVNELLDEPVIVASLEIKQ